ncbi:MAG: TolC family protein [Haliscomenobacter sp.]|nr:TolC family protein [Haliscomenobacter sp.]
MKYLIPIILIAGFSISASAQDTLLLTLEDALTRGLQHNYDLRNQRVNIDLAKKEFDKLGARRAPVVIASGDLRTNLVLPTTIIPGAAFASQGQDAEDREIRFGTIFNLSGTVSATYPVIDPVLSSDREIAGVKQRLEETIFEKQKTNTRLAIAEAWYDVLLQQEQSRLAAQKQSRAQDLLAITATRLEAGVALPSDLERSRLDTANARAAWEQAQNQLVLSRQTLAFRTGLPMDTPIAVSGITVAGVPDAPSDAQPEQRWELREEQLRLDLTRLEIDRLGQQYKPNLSLYGSASVQHLSDDFAIWQRWFPLVFAGLQANLTLFDGQLKRRNQEIVQLQGLQRQQNLERWREDIRYEIAIAQTALQNASVQWTNYRQNLDIAARLLELERERYAGGKALYSDYLNAEYSLREAENNLLRGWYAYLTAKLKWEKAAGVL